MTPMLWMMLAMLGLTGASLGKGIWKTGKELKLGEKQLEQQGALAMAGQEATGKQFEYLEGKGKADRALMLKLRGEERGEAREERAMVRRQGSQDRQTAMMMAVVQSLMSRPPVGGKPPINPNSMTSLLR